MIGSTVADNRGFSLIEMMVVIFIAGILAMAAVFAMNSGASKLRGVAFRLRGDINLARAEAVNRNADVLVEFLTGVSQGYRICIDDPGSTNINQCGDPTDTPIKSVTFSLGVRYYNQNAAGGPTIEADNDGDNDSPWTANSDFDGIRLGSDSSNGDDNANYVIFRSNGTPDKNGTVYIYYADVNTLGIVSGPIAVDFTTVGRVKLVRWNNGAWRTR